MQQNSRLANYMTYRAKEAHNCKFKCQWLPLTRHTSSKCILPILLTPLTPIKNKFGWILLKYNLGYRHCHCWGMTFFYNDLHWWRVPWGLNDFYINNQEYVSVQSDAPFNFITYWTHLNLNQIIKLIFISSDRKFFNTALPSLKNYYSPLHMRSK